VNDSGEGRRRQQRRRPTRGRPPAQPIQDPGPWWGRRSARIEQNRPRVAGSSGAAVRVSRLFILWWVLAVVLAGVGGAALGVAFAGQQHAPQPTAAQANPDTTPATVTITETPTATPTPAAQAPGTGTSKNLRPKPALTKPRLSEPPTTPEPTTAPLVLAASAPLAIKIPSIGVQSTLLQLGLNPDKSIEVPPLDDPDSKAGWYKYSPTPG